MNRNRSWDLRSALAIVWLIFTVALSVWLLVFITRLFNNIEELKTAEAIAILKHYRMVAYEMGTMILALLLGGAGLLYLIWLERSRSDQIHQFFAVFSHELKTSISRLRLQAEGLQDDLKKSGRGGPALRLLDDMGKLEVQLENSLWVARGEEDLFLIETIPLSRAVGELAREFPLLVHLSSEAWLQADHRAVESILKNIFQNSVQHGDAQNLWIDTTELSPGRLLITFRDDGSGFQGDKLSLGQIFKRHSRSGGTGLGLYLIRRLSELQNGTARFVPATQGFQVEIEIRGSLTSPTRSEAQG